MKIIVAYQKKDFGIGLKGKIPWHLSDDLKFFKLMTVGHNIAMGRKTFESIGNSLKKRKNWILSKTLPKNILYDNLKVVGNLTDIPSDSIVIGGAQIYKAVLQHNLVDTIIATETETCFLCDTFFPCPQWPSELVKLGNLNIRIYYREFK